MRWPCLLGKLGDALLQPQGSVYRGAGRNISRCNRVRSRLAPLATEPDPRWGELWEALGSVGRNRRDAPALLGPGPAGAGRVVALRLPGAWPLHAAAATVLVTA